PAPAATEAGAAAAASARGLAHLRRCEAQRRADLVHFELDDGAFLALASLERPLPQPALHDDPVAAVHGLRDVFGRLAPDTAAKEQRVAVLPLIRLPVEG